MTTSPRLQTLGNRLSKAKRGHLDKIETTESKLYLDTMLNEVNKRDKEIYESRIQELSNTLLNSIAAIKGDQLLSTMMEELTSQEFAQHRIKEIIEECIETDREALIQDMAQRNSALELDYNDLEQEYLKVYKTHVIMITHRLIDF